MWYGFAPYHAVLCVSDLNVAAQSSRVVLSVVEQVLEVSPDDVIARSV